MNAVQSREERIEKLASEFEHAEAVLIGAGAGLSASVGFSYSGKRFHENFSDFEAKYPFRDMYAGGFYSFPTPEEHWAYWSRFIFLNRYTDPPKRVYERLYALIKDKDYFVLTTNVDHCFQKAGFDKKRLFYTQGDYGLFQCASPCHLKTYDNEDTIRRMVSEQKAMRIPSELIPRCPVCGKPMTTHLRADDKFVQDEGWYAAYARYQTFLRTHGAGRLLLLELGVGGNTPAVIKYPFWHMAVRNGKAFYACVNYGEAFCPKEIEKRSVCLNGDIGAVLSDLSAR